MQINIAGAGAGKTTSMAASIVEMREKTNDKKNIYCITFTNNATLCIEQKLKEHYGIIPDNIIISTIHSFLYREFIRPYYYLLFGRQYSRISIAEMPQNPGYKNAKIKRLEDWGLLHQSVIPERAKWVVAKKSDDRKAVKDKRDVVMSVFKEYCGGICIDEAQDIDLDMQRIIEKLHELNIPLVLMGVPKQDLRGHKCLQSLVEKYNKSVVYIGICHRCPQKHLVLSNSIVCSYEQQHSDKVSGYLSIWFETDKSYNELVEEKIFDLCYISQKHGKFETHKFEESNGIIVALSEEIEGEMRNTHPNWPELILHRVSYYYAELLLRKYNDFCDSATAMSETFKSEKLSRKAYGIIINMLPDNSNLHNKEKFIVNSIDSIKGKEGENCLFILTTDLAAYLFCEKSEDTKMKSRLYVALTRSLDKLTIFITKEVEEKYKKEFIIDFFDR